MSPRVITETCFKTALVCVGLLLVPVCASNVFSGDPCKTVVEGNVEFATSVLSAYHEEEWMYSPLGFFAMYSLVYLGARGKTAQELAKVLHLPNQPELVRKGMREMMHTMNDRMPFDNQIFVDKHFPVKPEFLKQASEIFRAGVKTVAFNSGNIKHVFSSWVSNATHRGIDNYINNLSTPPGDKWLFFVNTARFQGKWLNKFKPENTKFMPFTVYDTVTKHVKMMNVEANFKLVKNDLVDAHILELPFEEPDNPVGFVFILPFEVDGLSSVQEKLQATSLRKVTDMSNVSARRINLFVPKFEASGRFDFVDELSKDFGLTNLFGHRSDLSGVSDTPVALLTFYQETELKVTEEGTVASEATSSFVVESRGMKADHPGSTVEKFVVDRPFLYMIRCAKTGNILFMGRCPDPNGDDY